MQGAIFDMDGLLIDSEKVWQRVWRALAAERGVTLGETFSREIIGTGGEQARAVLARHFRTDEPEAILRACSARVRALEERGVPLKPGVHTILAGLRAAGYRVAVASSSPMEMIAHNLRVCGIDGYFDALVSGREAAHSKPAPDVFLLAAKRLGLPPEECWVFEDSHSGVEAGWRARCRVVMIPDLVPPDARARERCWGIFGSLDEAWEAIKKDGV